MWSEGKAAMNSCPAEHVTDALTFFTPTIRTCSWLRSSVQDAIMSLKKVKSKKLAPSSSVSRKVVTPKASTSAAPPLEQISQLEKKLTSSTSKNADLNPLLDLLDIVSKSKKVKTQVAGLNALHNAFTVLISQGKVLGKVRQQTQDEQADPQASALMAVREWVKERWNDYQTLLCALLSSPEPALAVRCHHLYVQLQWLIDISFADCIIDCLDEPPKDDITIPLRASEAINICLRLCLLAPHYARLARLATTAYQRGPDRVR